MPKYNLTPRLQNLVRELVDSASANGSSEHFFYVGTFKFSGVTFIPNSKLQVAIEQVDLEILRQQGLIHYSEATGRGSILNSAFEAVKNDFEIPAAAASNINISG